MFLKINTILKTYITWKQFLCVGWYGPVPNLSLGELWATTGDNVTAGSLASDRSAPTTSTRRSATPHPPGEVFQGWCGDRRPWRWCPLMSYISGHQPSILIDSPHHLTKWHHQLQPRWPCHHSNSLRRTSQLFATLVKDPATARPGWATKWDHLPGKKANNGKHVTCICIYM